MMRALRYALDEAAASLWRGRDSGLLSIGTIALALFVLGGFLLVTTNLDQLGSQWASAAEMSVYLSDGVTPDQRAALERALASDGGVAGYEYVSKAEARARFRRTFGDLAATMDDLGDNPLPASYEVRLRNGQSARADLEALGGRLRQTPGVSDVRYDREWLDRLWAAVTIIRGIGMLLASALAVAAALTVANVVRLALHARRDEIGIMQLVGAPQAYIRGPFLMEGVLQGGIGSLVALVALTAGYLVLRARYLPQLAAAINQTAVHFLPVELCL